MCKCNIATNPTQCVNDSAGNDIINGGAIVSIQRKFWIAVILYIIIQWCMATAFTLVVVKLM